MKYLKLSITNKSPIRIVNDDTSQHGQIDTLHHIPGSTIRGLVANSLCQDKEYFESVKKLLFSSHVRFLNAYPQAGGRELVPSWKGFYEDKSVADGMKLVQNVVAAEDGEVSPGTKRAALGRYCCVEDGLEGQRCIRYGDVALGEELNINCGGNSRKNVFRSQYIQKNQRFCGYILFDDQAEKLMGRVKQVFEQVFYVGSDRSLGLGACVCSSVLEEQGLPYGELREREACSEFYLVLLSHMVMRNSFGELAGLNLETIGEILGCGRLKLERCAASVVEVFGYNRNWGGQIPSAVMYEAGSVFRIKTESGEKISKEGFLRLEERGLGIRKNEGFGQVLVDNRYPQISCKQKLPQAGEEAREGNIGDMPEREEGLVFPWKTEAEDIAIAAKGVLECRIRRAMERCVVDSSWKEKLMSISGSSRGIVLSLCQELKYNPKEARQSLMEWIRHSEEKDSQKKVFDKKSGKEALRQYLRSVMDRDFGKVLGIEGEDAEILGQSFQEILSEEEMIYYRLKLVIQQLRYLNREEKGNAGQ